MKNSVKIIIKKNIFKQKLHWKTKTNICGQT